MGKNAIRERIMKAFARNTLLEKAVTAAWKNQEMFQRAIQQIRAHIDVAFSLLE